ncbi:SEC10/PgrA surface exclusion domain-containing protein [Streptococcus oralis]|uniref:SEC10/PgrA surface exclusion domain-containing protein n=1 Tax=Streptococcus oralis TaxID=1303 RepID=UPI002283E99D|nr:SEC10/PgrA surface exclusion domain-containing protein [Streptococcus oralis]MCY7072266.1 SEC10/PgrA surface exclusion domain-containing protein [Streptococcus oralis]
MKKSLIMTTTALATSLGAAATAPTVFATEAPTENTVSAAVNDKVTDKDLSNAEKRAVDAAKDADQKTKDAGQAKDDLDKAQKDKNAKTAEKEVLEKALEKAKDATPEKIQKETEDVNSKEKSKTDKGADSKDKADQVTKKSDEAKRAKDELDKARTGVENADKELKDATDDFDPAAKDKAQKEKDNADKDVRIKDQAKRDAETELEKAKEAEKTREAKKSQERQNKADKEADKTAKEGDVRDAEQTIKDAEEKLKTAQYPTDVVLTPEWRDKAKELIHKYKERYPEPYPDFTGMNLDQINKADEAWSARRDVWLEKERKDIRRLEDELIKLDRQANENWTNRIRNIRKNGLRDDNTDVKYDPNNLPQDVVDELNDRFITLLNSLRKQLNLPEAKLNTNKKDFAKEVAKVYKDNDYQGKGHFGRGINEVARKRGLATSANPGVETTDQYYENLMTRSTSTDKMTKQELIAALTETFLSFFAEGYKNGHYGHFYSLLQADSLGLNTSLIKGGQILDAIVSQYWTHLFRIHVLNVQDADSIDNADTDIRKAKFDELYGPNSKANLPTPTVKDKGQVEVELEKAKADKKTAEANLEQVKTELQEIEKRISNLEKEVSETPAKEAKRTEAVKELDKAKEKAEDAKRKLERATLDDKAKSLRLEKARKAKEEADKELAKKLAESRQKDKDLENAKIERLKAEKELKDAKDALQKAKDKLAETIRLSQEKANLEAELKAKSKELDELGKYVDDLKRDVKQKEEEAEKARKAKDDAEHDYQKLLLRKTIDDALIPEQPEFKGGVNGEGLIQPELPEFPMEKLPVDEPKVEQPKVELPKVDEPKNEQPKVEEPGKDPSQEPSKEPGKEPGQSGDQYVKPVGPAPSYQAPAVLSQAKQEAEQKALPNTGSQVSLLALLGYGFLAGLGMILKKKEG